MLKISNIPTKRLLSLLIKLLIVSLAFGYIYYKVFLSEDAQEVGQYVSELLDSEYSLAYLILAGALMPVNWGLETFKWRFLISKIEQFTFFRAFRAIFSGVTTSLAAPNRMGEFAGRVLYLNRSDRIQGILITVLGSIAQLLITLMAGGIALVFYMIYFMELQSVPYLPQMTAVLVAAFIAVVLFIFLNTRILTFLLKKLRLPKRHHRYLEVFSYFSPKDLLQVLAVSALRYTVFTLQYYCLLRVTLVDISLADTFILVPLIFLTMTAIPTVSFLEIVVRESTALTYIGLVSTNNLGIITASFSLWMINLALPALLGGLFIFGVRIFRNRRKS